ncbi:MAG: GNAT family N-acetyltransferase [Acidimicrobiales bacterium]
MTRHWPLFDLRIRSERLELRLPTDDELGQLGDLAAAGIHDPDAMPFLVPWSRAASPALERGMMQHHWQHRTAWTPESWELSLGVFVDGTIVGNQAVAGRQFAVSRTVSSGSWLGRAHQGQGLGTEMRIAVLAFAFDHLGAVRAESGAYVDNERSLRVSRSIGYHDDGMVIRVSDGRRREEQRFAIDVDTWRSRPRPEVAVDGLDGCRDMFGI